VPICISSRGKSRGEERGFYAQKFRRGNEIVLARSATTRTPRRVRNTRAARERARRGGGKKRSAPQISVRLLNRRARRRIGALLASSGARTG
jgi:hypothetical protein